MTSIEVHSIANLKMRKKSDRQYRIFEASRLRSNHSIANLSFCTLHCLTLARRRFEGFGQNPSRTEGKSMVFTASGSDLPCPCGDARLARGSMSLLYLVNFRNFGRNASVLGWSDTPLRGAADYSAFSAIPLGQPFP